ncbi:DMT family transporter [Nitrosarchaeum sp.]|uniref:DMT family transporter n=1 Tax=Nitrosarchaeum sp. TaxID=2026886 RepID=UPI00247B5F04|nr:DMT family transporter [Nitrosarchaeum sp.]MCV0411673.1 DMT family transporter [Nitrosarchaeum sp.]
MGMSVLDIARKSHYGYYFIIIAAALAALVHVLSKPMLEVGTSQIEINPIVMAFLVYFICGVFFTPLVKKSPKISKISRRDITFMLLIGITEGAGLITYFYGISTSTAVNASIFSNSEIIFALVIAMLVFKERLHIKECIPFSMIIIGMMIIPIGNDLYQNDFSFSLVTGDLLIIFSGLLYAIDITLCKYLSERFDVKKTVQVVSFTCAAITISIIALFQIPIDIELAQIPNILVMSIAGTGMSTLFFLMGLKLIGAVRTVLLYSTTSIFGIIFSGLILSEVVTFTDIISVVLVLSGIFLLRNRLAETETIGPKHKTSNRSHANHVSFTKKRKTSNVSKWIHNKVAEKISQVFPNSGIG